MAINIEELDSLSDEEFMQKSSSIIETLDKDEDNTSNDTNVDKDSVLDTDKDSIEPSEPEGLDTKATDNTDTDNKDVDSSTEPSGSDNTDDTNEEPKETTKSSGSDKEPSKNTDTDSNTDQPVNYEELYKQVTAPFKANGKTVQISDPKDIIRLMQQGANFTKKMQELAPYRKAMLMLQQNNLLDENKLSFLIDLNKKDPNAINKFIKDNNIDQFSIDPDKADEYVSGRNIPSNQEVEFRSSLEEISKMPRGLELINEAKSWDAQSQGAIYNDPNILRAIQEHKNNGVYDKIVAEKDRLELLGYIPSGTPFLQAYKFAGDNLMKQTQQLNMNQQQGMQPAYTQQIQQQQVHHTDPNINKQIKATGSVRSTGKKASVLNIDKLFEMSDEDFSKQYDAIMKSIKVR